MVNIVLILIGGFELNVDKGVEVEVFEEDFGLSIEEEFEGELFEDVDGGDFDFGVLDVGGLGEEDEEEDDGDWDVDDEDWELVNGGM